MCQICGMNAHSYPNSLAVTSASGGDATQTATSNQAPQWGGTGANFRTTQTATSDTNTNGVLAGAKWGGATLTYSFPTVTTQYDVSYGPEITNGFFAATNGIKDGIRYAMNLLSQYTNMVTTEIAANTNADVRVAGSSEANPTAYAYYPSDSNKGGDVWYGSSYTSYNTAIKGRYEWTTSIHELGHALGLKHGHEMGGVSNTAMDTAHDQMAYSVMTYKSYQGGPITGYTNELNGYAQTFMMYDIAALQTMYGANFNTNSGNSTYTWSRTTGEMFINGVGQGAPGGNRIFMTVWDGNGIDTYDFSNYTSNLTIDLTPGSFSITSSTQLANLGSGHFAPGNIFNALQFNGDLRSLIENAIGGSGNDTIIGNAASSILSGNEGNDVLLGGLGADQLIGGSGNDALIGDGPVVWDDNADAIRHLYIATLNRAPDDSGHQGWVGALTSGQTLMQIATGFINSVEFKSTYGSLNNQQFVTLLYNNVLHRTPDAGGLSGWVGSLAAGASRESVIVGFSESVEFKISTEIRNHSGQIYRLYETTFNRIPDVVGFSGWIDLRYSGVEMNTIANQFMISQEFINTYGNINSLTNAQFVTLLYNNVLNRAPDSSGFSGWVGAIDSGTKSRVDVLLDFSESQEHVDFGSFGLNSFMRNSVTNWQDVLESGSGNDTLSGGRGADRFVFNFSDGGVDTVFGFEGFDILNMRGFGYTNASQALSHMMQEGGDVVFRHDRNIIVFHDTQFSTLQNLNNSGWIFT